MEKDTQQESTLLEVPDIFSESHSTNIIEISSEKSSFSDPIPKEVIESRGLTFEELDAKKSSKDLLQEDEDQQILSQEPPKDEDQKIPFLEEPPKDEDQQILSQEPPKDEDQQILSQEPPKDEDQKIPFLEEPPKDDQDDPENFQTLDSTKIPKTQNDTSIEFHEETPKIPIPQRGKNAPSTENITPKKTSVSQQIEPDFSSMKESDLQQQMKLLEAQYTILFNKKKINDIPVINKQNILSYYRQYNRLIRNMKAKRNSGIFRLALIVSWVILEYVCYKFGLNAKGFTIFQLKLLNYYDDILAELGEEYEMFGGLNWRPEVKLLLISFGSLLVFVVANYLMSFIGEDNAKLLQNSFVMVFTGNGNEIVNKISDFIDEKVMPVVNGDKSETSSIGDVIGNVDVGGIINGIGKVFGEVAKKSSQTEVPHRRRRPTYTQ